MFVCDVWWVVFGVLVLNVGVGLLFVLLCVVVLFVCVFG